ncbi:MAG: permease [Bacilli bacterium]|nr:permease [Bacilli bacterium]
MKTKIKNFFSKLFKNKVFWICFAIVFLGLIITWCILAPGSGASKIVSVGDAMARFIGLFLLLALGLALGRVTIKGISFGSAGVFLVALGIGAAFASVPTDTPWIGRFVLIEKDIEIYGDVLENFGLILFASAVGFIAGPTFFRSFKSNAKSFITMGISVTVVGILLTALIGLIPDIGPFYASGIFSGAITSTPALAAANEIASKVTITVGGVSMQASSLVTIGYAVTYPLGVLGVVLFIQLMPRILKADMSMERGRLIVSALKSEMHAEKAEEEKQRLDLDKTYFEVDSYGLTPFAIAVFCGLLLGSITIPLTPDGYNGSCFSLGTTGGCLLSCITFAHFGHVGKMSFKVPENVNKTFREFGLIVFLAGIGIVGGYNLVLYGSQGAVTGLMIALGIGLGVIITVVPMIGGYFMGKYLFKLPLLNNLGAITGSMTSTPALGALISMAKTDDVATAYASAFPIATILTAIGMNFYLSLLA